MVTANITELVSATHLLALERATLADAILVASRHAAWDEDGRPLLVIDGDQLRADVANLSWVKAFLAAAADQRREDRINNADQQLTAAHEALLSKNRSQRGPQWTSEMMDSFRRVSRALLELIDAREDAGEISADRATRLRSSAESHLRKTEEIGMSAAHKAIRMARNF